MPSNFIKKFKARQSKMLDDKLLRATRSTSKAVAKRASSSGIAVLLEKFAEEAARLKEQNQVFTKNNPVLQAAFNEIDTTYAQAAEGLMGVDGEITDEAIRAAQVSFMAMYFIGLHSTSSRHNIDEAFRVAADPTTSFEGLYVDRSILGHTLVDTTSWYARVSQWGSGHATRARRLVAAKAGTSPTHATKILKSFLVTFPVFAINNIMTTLFMNIFRESESTFAGANAGHIVQKIRIATLDTRTCLACIAKHGTHLGLFEKVADHGNGRCTAFYTFAGLFAPEIETGNEWFAGLSPARQKKQRSFQFTPSKLDIYRDTGTLDTFVYERHDVTFGEQLLEASIKRIQQK